MALINCPECNHKISDTAKMCPNCGFYVKKHIHTINNYENSNCLKKEAKKSHVYKYIKLLGLGMMILTVLFVIITFARHEWSLSEIWEARDVANEYCQRSEDKNSEEIIRVENVELNYSL